MRSDLGSGAETSCGAVRFTPGGSVSWSQLSFHLGLALYCVLWVLSGECHGCIEEALTMKTVAASATFSGNAKKLFQDPATARETARKVLISRSANTGAFIVNGLTIRTTAGTPQKKKK